MTEQQATEPDNDEALVERIAEEIWSEIGLRRIFRELAVVASPLNMERQLCIRQARAVLALFGKQVNFTDLGVVVAGDSEWPHLRAPTSELECAQREVIASAQIWFCARRDLAGRHDLKGDLQMSMRAAEQGLDEAVELLAICEGKPDA